VSELTHDDVQRILRIIDEMGDRDVHLEIGELKLHVTRGASSSEFTAAPKTSAAVKPVQAATASEPPPTAPVEVPAGHVAIRAPTMGTFYRASSPGAKPHAEIGDHVQPDDTVGIVTYASGSGIALEPTKISYKQKIFAAIDKLEAGGSTNGAGGIADAYRLAEAGFDKSAVNRECLTP